MPVWCAPAPEATAAPQVTVLTVTPRSSGVALFTREQADHLKSNEDGRRSKLTLPYYYPDYYSIPHIDSFHVFVFVPYHLNKRPSAIVLTCPCNTL